MSARRRSREGSKAKRFFLLFFLILILGGGVYLVWFSGVFTIREVEVIGEELLAEQSFRDIKGQNILFWEPDVDLSGLHRVAGIGVTKEYFNGKVVINLESRDRYTIWCLESKEVCYWIDETGVAFSEAPDLEGPLVFRLVRDATDREISLGESVLDQELFVNLVLAFNFLEETNVEAYEFRIDDLKFKEALAKVKNGPDIYFSLTLDPSFGKGVVSSLRDSGEWNLISYLDLRVPNRAYFSQ